eukprot:TRINITY_DN18647_c0_g1_i1.p1 TRINITY_DN18647_c0_g1~~TRINITY_DN18647_c0_g1_i1.p1  ORF type:complete len:414 (+),score=98.98 TRINITY_DN18647_c0_g1_i1:164-1405(+)
MVDCAFASASASFAAGWSSGPTPLDVGAAAAGAATAARSQTLWPAAGAAGGPVWVESFAGGPAELTLAAGSLLLSAALVGHAKRRGRRSSACSLAGGAAGAAAGATARFVAQLAPLKASGRASSSRRKPTAAEAPDAEAEAAAAKSDCEQQVGWVDSLGQHGPEGLELNDFIPTPVVAARAPDDVSKTSWSASAPSAQRDGYDAAGARGPRFGLLPPPERPEASLRDGAGQPAFLSQMDAFEDVRLTAFQDAQKASDDEIAASAICLVPEPYYRAKRPDQFMRAPSIACRHQPFTMDMEALGRWEWPDERQELTLAQMRRCLVNEKWPISGGREKLLLHGKAVTTKDLEACCLQLGLWAPTRNNMRANLDAYLRHLWETMSEDDFSYEARFRGLTQKKLRRELEAKGRLTKAT